MNKRAVEEQPAACQRQRVDMSAEEVLAAAENEGLPLNPGFGEFIDHFYDYRAVSRPVRVHTTPYSWHLGNDIRFFDRVFKLERIGEMTEFLSGRLERPFPVRHENKSAPDVREANLTARQIDRLLQISEPDYTLLGDMYDIGKAQEMLAA